MSDTVYELLDADGRPLYIGATTFIAQRLNVHGRWVDVWEQVASIRLHRASDRRDMLRLEAELIAQHRPPYNIAGNPDAVRRERSENGKRGNYAKRSARTAFHRAGDYCNDGSCRACNQRARAAVKSEAVA